MPYSLNNYCFPSISDVAAIESSSPILPNSVGWPVITGVSASGSSVRYNFISYNHDGTTNSAFFQRTYSSCTTVGQIYNSSGLSIEDVTTLAWLVILPMAVAFGFKQLTKIPR